MHLLLTTVLLSTVLADFDDFEWNQFKATHKKVYTTEKEDARRRELYLKRKEMVEEHNKRYDRGESTYEMAVNKFSDWFQEELDQVWDSTLNLTLPSVGKLKLKNVTEVPDSINWVMKGAVTSVKDQYRCSSSYAFSSVGALEGLMFLKNNTITDLSAQELIDCTFLRGCHSQSIPFDAYMYVMTRPGIDTDKSYPYTGYEQQCRRSSGKIGAYCTGMRITEGEASLKNTLGTIGPVTVYMNPGVEFFHYKNGIYDGVCDFTRIVWLLAVGYDSDKKQQRDYWLIKNSWGTSWGNQGYAKVLRGQNLCNIGGLITYPLHI